jgi:CheY-like chemotaxis protein
MAIVDVQMPDMDGYELVERFLPITLQKVEM